MAPTPSHAHDAGLAAVVEVRSRQLTFRLGIGAMVVLFYGPAFGFTAVFIWFALYMAAQLTEVVLAKAFSGRLGGWRRSVTLASLSVSAVVFGSLTPELYKSLGNFGMGCGAFLLAGSILTTIQSTTRSRAAFLAIICPFFFYALASPLIASTTSTTLTAFLGYQMAAIMIVLYTLSTWRQARRAQDAETAALVDLQASEAAARADKAFLNVVIENMPAMLLVKDVATGRYRMINRTGETMLGRLRSDMVGRTDHEIFAPDVADAFVAGDRALLAHDAPLTFDSERVDTERGERELRVQKALLRGAGGDELIMVMAEDVTEQRITARALEGAAEAAETANRAKSAFLATMSHEIRTPLNGVIGMAQAMSADDLSPIQRDRLGVIREAGALLLAVLNDVLDLSKIEAGQLTLEETDFEMAELVRGARAGFADQAHRKGLGFSFTVDPEADGAYCGDSTRLRQILYNLISNALKFTEAGEVGVHVSSEGGRLAFEVSDTGIGMTPDQVELLFARFVQGDVSTTRRFGGTGLGLSICRELAQLMAGDIEVQTELGAGSTFTLRLALQRAVQGSHVPSEPPVAEAASHPPLKVLAAEDNPMNQRVLRALLQQIGVEPTVVENGRLAVDAWAREPWDIILMDMQMPEMDGLTAARAIRQAEALEGRPRTPIVALTANAMSHHLADYVLGGMDGHVAKPIEAAKLFAALETHLLGPAEPGNELDLAAA